MTEKQQLFAERLNSFQPTPWNQIPDLGLYMDQVITFIERQCKELFLGDDRVFTPSMINNYVKIGLISRPVAKKYGRDQLAQLLMICILKQSVSAENMKSLVQPPTGSTMQAHYEAFCQTEQTVIAALGSTMPLPLMTCAVQGAAYLILCSTLLQAQKEEAAAAARAAHNHKNPQPKPDEKKK